MTEVNRGANRGKGSEKEGEKSCLNRNRPQDIKKGGKSRGNRKEKSRCVLHGGRTVHKGKKRNVLVRKADNLLSHSIIGLRPKRGVGNFPEGGVEHLL